MHDEDDEGDCPDRRLRALANQRSERVLIEVATWLEMKGDDSCSPALCRLIAMHYDLLAEHREVVSRAEMVAQYRRRAAHWRLRAAAFGRALDDVASPSLSQAPHNPTKTKRQSQEDLI